MAVIKVTQQYVDVYGTGDASGIRVATQNVEVLGTVAQPNLIVAAQNVEVLGVPLVPVIDVALQHVQVAGTKSGYSRVERGYLEVLSGGGYELQEALNLVETTSLEGIYNLDPNDSLVLVETHNVGRTKRHSISEALVLTDEAIGTCTHQWSDDTLVLTDTVTHWFPQIALESVSEFYSVTETIEQHGSIRLDLNDSLVLVDETDNIIKYRSADDILTITDAATSVWSKTVSDTLVLTDALLMGTWFISLTDTIDLVESARSLETKISITDTLSLVESTHSNIQSQEITEYVTLTETTHTPIPYHISVEDKLQWISESLDPDTLDIIYTQNGLTEDIYLQGTLNKNVQDYLWIYDAEANVVHIQWDAIDCNASDTLSLGEIINFPLVEVVSDTLALVEDCYGWLGPAVTDSLNLVETLNYTFVKVEAVVDELINLTESVMVDLESIDMCGYNPLLGNIPVIDPNASGVTLSYPAISPTTTVTLRGPELGNKESLEYQRINRETRGGTLIIFADPMWPKIKKLGLSFTGLSEVTGQALLTFLTTSLGQEIALLDWEGNTHNCICINPEEAIIRQRACDLQISLEFEVTLTPVVSRPTDLLAISETLVSTTTHNRATTDNFTNHEYMDLEFIEA